MANCKGLFLMVADIGGVGFFPLKLRQIQYIRISKLLLYFPFADCGTDKVGVMYN